MVYMKYLYIILVLGLFLSCGRDYRYLKSPDEKQVLTVFEITGKDNKSYTIVAYGKHTGDEMPKSYLKVRNRWSDGWECLIQWESNQAILYEPYSLFEEINIGDSFLNHAIRAFYEIFYDEKNKTYTRLSSSDVIKIIITPPHPKPQLHQSQQSLQHS